MKTKFFLCMRPPVSEPDDGDYVKLPPTVGSSYSRVTGETSGRRNPGLQQRKRVAPEKFIRQLSIKSNSNRFSGNISAGESANPVEKDCQKCEKSTNPVSESKISIPFPGQKSVSLKKPNLISNSNIRRGPESKSGVYLMVSSLLFTVILGKILGILCTLILLYSLFPRRKKDVTNDDRGSINMVGKSQEKGSPEEYKKRVIMEGLLERKSHNRESIKFFS